MRAGFMRRASRESPGSGSSKKAAASDWYVKQFDQYVEDSDQIGPEGIEALCSALGVEVTDVHSK